MISQELKTDLKHAAKGACFVAGVMAAGYAIAFLAIWAGMR